VPANWEQETREKYQPIQGGIEGKDKGENRTQSQEDQIMEKSQQCMGQMRRDIKSHSAFLLCSLHRASSGSIITMYEKSP